MSWLFSPLKFYYYVSAGVKLPRRPKKRDWMMMMSTLGKKYFCAIKHTTFTCEG